MVKLVDSLPNVTVDISLLVVVLVVGGGADIVVVLLVVVFGGGADIVAVLLVVVLVVFSLVLIDVVTIVVGTEYSIGIFSSRFIILYKN